MLPGFLIHLICGHLKAQEQKEHSVHEPIDFGFSPETGSVHLISSASGGQLNLPGLETSTSKQAKS